MTTGVIIDLTSGCQSRISATKTMTVVCLEFVDPVNESTYAKLYLSMDDLLRLQAGMLEGFNRRGVATGPIAITPADLLGRKDN